MRALWLLVAVITLLPAAVRAADVTEVPVGVSTEAIKAFRAGLELHKNKEWARRGQGV